MFAARQPWILHFEFGISGKSKFNQNVQDHKAMPNPNDLSIQDGQRRRIIADIQCQLCEMVRHVCSLYFSITFSFGANDDCAQKSQVTHMMHLLVYMFDHQWLRRELKWDASQEIAARKMYLRFLLYRSLGNHFTHVSFCFVLLCCVTFRLFAVATASLLHSLCVCTHGGKHMAGNKKDLTHQSKV